MESFDPIATMEFYPAVAELSVSVMAARRSLDLLADLGSPLGTTDRDPLLFFFANVPTLTDSTLQLRCALYLPDGAKPDLTSRGRKFANVLTTHGWHVRLLSVPPSINCLIMDAETVIVGNPAFTLTGCTPVLTAGSKAAQEVVQHFATIRQTALATQTGEELLYEDILRPSVPDIEKRILVVAQEGWQPILRYLNRNPNALYELAPRRFEELIAELLSREGFEVHLTPRTRDGGLDILAVQNSSVGRQLYVVECKRYARQRRIDVGLVRSLYGVVEQRRVTAGVLVTTSYFSKDALKFREAVEWRLALKDYDAVRDWIRVRARGTTSTHYNGA